MKSNQEVSFQVYENSETEALKERTTRTLTENVQKAGRRDAEENLPHPVGDQLSHYLDPELNALQQHVDKLRDMHRADESVSKTIEKHQRQAQHLRNHRDDLKAEIKDGQAKLTNLKGKYPTNLAIGLAAVVLLLGLMEGVMSISAIRVLIASFFIALPIAIIFGLGWAVISHHFARWFNSGRTKGGRFLRRCALITGVSAAFFVLGMLRSYHIKVASMAIEEGIGGGILAYADPQEALIYCLLSWVVFLPAVILSKYTPNKEEWMSIFQKRKLEKQLSTLQGKLDAIETEIKALTTEIENLKIWEESRNLTAKRDEQSAIRIINYLKSLYIQSNLRHRLDKKRPDCFDKEFKFYLTLYFQDAPTINQSLNSK